MGLSVAHLRSLLISGGGTVCAKRGCPHSNADSNTVPVVVFAKTEEGCCSGQPPNVKQELYTKHISASESFPAPCDSSRQALESVTACQRLWNDLILHRKIFFYFWLCLINLGTLVGSWQQACKVRFVHCSLSLMKWSVSGARKLGWSGLMWVSWW